MTKTVPSELARFRWMISFIAGAFLLGIFSSHHLFWEIGRTYPAYPSDSFFRSIPASIILAFEIALIASLCGAALFRKSLYIVIALSSAVMLFLCDGNRLFPSFYEYSCLLFILSFFTGKAAEEEKRRGLSLARLVIALIYFWSGILKIGSEFQGQLTWVFAPVLTLFPCLAGNPLRIAAAVAPFIEAEIGVALLFRKTRAFALIEALIMHGLLFFLISPIRDPYHGSAWIWNISSAGMVILLFMGAQVSARDIALDFTEKKIALLRGCIWVIFGILPAFNLVNAWNSSLSFNVFSGNVATAEIYLDDHAVQKLPSQLIPYLQPETLESGRYAFSLSSWSEHEFNAEPIPESNIFLNDFLSICKTIDNARGAVLIIRDKKSIFRNSRTTSYQCPQS